MVELEQIKQAVAPENILLVADAMIGQDAVKTAAEFDRRLALDGFILTKLDGDARGGAALSIKEVTGKPIKFLGMGESLDRLEEFRPEGLASRILGFGDIVGLVKDFEQHVDEETAEADAQKILSGDFTLEDFVNQIRLVRKMGPLGELMEKFPLFGELPEGFQFDDQALTKIVAMVDSMTQTERQRPDVITDARVKRIARGSGRDEKEVRDLLKQYNAMRGVMKQIGSAPGPPLAPPRREAAHAAPRKLQGKGMEDVLGADAPAVERRPPGRPRAGRGDGAADGAAEGLHAADGGRRDGARAAHGLRARANRARVQEGPRRPQQEAQGGAAGARRRRASAAEVGSQALGPRASGPRLGVSA